MGVQVRSCPVTIVEFLNARLDEDERASKAAPVGSRGRDRALAEVAAKRKIVRGYAKAHSASMRMVEPSPSDGPPEGGDPWSELLAWRLALNTWRPCTGPTRNTTTPGPTSELGPAKPCFFEDRGWPVPLVRAFRRQLPVLWIGAVAPMK